MSIPDWYTGSDHSGEVAAGIEKTIANMDDHVAGNEDILRLRDLLAVEDEVNWKAFLLSLLGTIQYDIGETEAAAGVLEDALGSYKPYLPSFDGVLSVYCQTSYTAGVLLFEQEMYAEAIPCLLRCLPYLHEVYDNAYVGDIYTLLNICLGMTDDMSASLVFAEAAAFARNCDCDSLENIMVAYFNVGEQDKAVEVFHILSERCHESDHFERILDFARKNLGETGVVN